MLESLGYRMSAVNVTPRKVTDKRVVILRLEWCHTGDTVGAGFGFWILD